MAPPWSMVDSSSDRRHGDMDDGDDDTDDNDDDDDDDDDDTDDDAEDDHDDDTDDDNDHKNDSYTAAGAAPGASVRCSLLQKRETTYIFLSSANLLKQNSNKLMQHVYFLIIG